MEKINIFPCAHIGVSATTSVHTVKFGEGDYEARCGIALLGATNMDAEGFKKCNSDPFHPRFFDNYASGKGKTEKEAIEAMKADMENLAEGIWAEAEKEK